MGNTIIQRERSLILDSDVDFGSHERIARDTSNLDCVGGYRVGPKLGLGYGLPKLVELTRKYSNKPIVYEQSGIDTELGEEFIRTLKGAGVNAVILFPQADLEAEKAWIEAALDEDLGVIVGGLIPHHKCLQSEGGYLGDGAIMKTYFNAADSKVKDFLVPANNPGVIKELRGNLESRGIEPVFYSRGFVAQDGSITDSAKAAGDRWHAIVKIYGTCDMRKVALEHASKL